MEFVENDVSIAPATVPAARNDALGLNASAADLCASLRHAMPTQWRRCKLADQEYDARHTATGRGNTASVSGLGLQYKFNLFFRSNACAPAHGCVATLEGYCRSFTAGRDFSSDYLWLELKLELELGVGSLASALAATKTV